MTGEFDSGSEQFSKSVSGFESDRNSRRNEYRILQDLSNLESLEGEERKKAIQYFDPYSNESSNVRERFVRIIAYNEESYKSKIAIDDESPLSIHLDHFKKITSALLKKNKNYYERSRQSRSNSAKM